MVLTAGVKKSIQNWRRILLHQHFVALKCWCTISDLAHTFAWKYDESITAKCQTYSGMVQALIRAIILSVLAIAPMLAPEVAAGIETAAEMSPAEAAKASAKAAKVAAKAAER